MTLKAHKAQKGCHLQPVTGDMCNTEEMLGCMAACDQRPQGAYWKSTEEGRSPSPLAESQAWADQWDSQESHMANL